jgi:hypothetical protein
MYPRTLHATNRPTKAEDLRPGDPATRPDHLFVCNMELEQSIRDEPGKYRKTILVK